MKIAVLGLGKMGSRIATKLHEEGHGVIVWNRSKAPIEELELKIKNSKLKITDQNFKIAKNIEDLVNNLESPRIIWLMLPAGESTQSVLDEVSKYLEKGDIVVDGGNAHFKDTEKRYRNFKKSGVLYLGIGVSGGILASENGYPLMVGGSKKAYQYIIAILDSLSKPNGGYEYFGEGGAGHFVKMVHNGIEYGIMQSLGEGFEVLEKSQYKFNLSNVARLWQKGTLVSGFMLDRVVDALAQNPNLENMMGPISESGEARWTVEEARKEGVEAEIIEKSLEYRIRSQKDKTIQNSFTAKVLNGLRNAFGGHAIKSS